MKRISALLLAVCLLFCTSCKEEQKEYSATQILMTTVVTVSVYADDRSVLDGAMELCRQYEQLFSRTVETSDISRINSAGGAPVTVAPETAELLNIALKICEESGGAFDITVTPLTELWNITKASIPPADADITEALKKVGYKNITVSGNTVTALGGATLDLGGIAKGYIADKLKDYLVSKGVTRGTINLGGNVVLIGDNDGKPYSVGIQKPFGVTGEAALTVKLSDKTAVTSGIYERYFEFEGSIYHHIIDTSTGYPTDSDIASVTIITDSSSIADGLSTACLVLGLEEGTKLAEKFGAETVFILRDGSIKVSDGLNIDRSGDMPCINLK